MKRGSASPVAAGFALAAGRPGIQPTDTFESIGGDSLAFVRASLALEEVLGDLPDGWERMTVAELDALAQRPAGAAPPARWSTVPTEWLLRIFATTMVIAHHANQRHADLLAGGAILLMIISGNSLASFQKKKILSGHQFEIIKNYFVNLIVPYYFVITLANLLSKTSHINWTSYFLLSNFILPPTGLFVVYWFVETLFHIILFTCILLLSKTIRNIATNHSYEFAIIYVIFGICLYFIIPIIHTFPLVFGIHTTPEYYFLYFALGFLMPFSSTTKRKIICILIAAYVIALQNDFSKSTFYVPFTGMVAMLLFPSIKLSRPQARIAEMVASATYFTYLVHILILHGVQGKLGVNNTAILVILSFMAGLAGTWAWGHLLLAIRSAWAGRLKPASRR